MNGRKIGAAYENQALKISAGTYTGLLRYVSGKNKVGGPFGTIGKAGDFLLEVSGVPGRTDILFHGGNKPSHSHGCILLGPVGRDPGSSIPSLDDQHPLRKLRLLFYGTDLPNATPDRRIVIEILDPSEPHMLTLRAESPTAEMSATIIAPGKSAHQYNVYYIDTQAFAGGVLDIDIHTSPDSTTNGSFDLFPPNTNLPRQGTPTGTLAHRYDVPRGTSTRLEYRFHAGQVFALGLEGNWFSQKGASGIVDFRVTVHQ